MAIKIFDAFGIVGVDKKRLATDLDGAVSLAKRAASKITGALTTALKVLTVSIPAAVAVSTLAFANLESGVAEVVTLLGESDNVARRSISDLSRIATDISVAFAQKLGPTVKATYDAISAGIPRAEIDAFLRSASSLAIGGVTDISTAVDILTSSINAFGFSSSRATDVSDKLFTGVRLGKTTVTELAQSFGFVAPIARAANVSIDETIAALATLTARGLQTTNATTALKGALQAIIAPSGEAEQEAARLGLQFNAEALAGRGLIGVLEDVNAATQGDIESTAKLFGNIRGLTAVLSLATDGGQKFAENILAVERSAGATATAVNVMKDTLTFAFAQSRQAVIALSTDIGRVFAPVAREFFDFITKSIVEVRRFIANNQQTIDSIADSIAFVAGQILRVFLPEINTADGVLVKLLQRLDRWLLGIADFFSENSEQLDEWSRRARQAVKDFLDKSLAAFDQWSSEKLQPIIDEATEKLKQIFDEAINGDLGWLDALRSAAPVITALLVGIMTEVAKAGVTALVIAFNFAGPSIAATLGAIGVSAGIAFVNGVIEEVTKGLAFLSAPGDSTGRAFARAFGAPDAFAAGGITQPGPFITGERGPEMQTGEGGSRILPSQTTQNIMNVQDGAIRIDGSGLGPDALEDVIARTLKRLERQGTGDLGVLAARGIG